MIEHPADEGAILDNFKRYFLSRLYVIERLR